MRQMFLPNQNAAGVICHETIAPLKISGRYNSQKRKENYSPLTGLTASTLM